MLVQLLRTLRDPMISVSTRRCVSTVTVGVSHDLIENCRPIGDRARVREGCALEPALQ